MYIILMITRDSALFALFFWLGKGLNTETIEMAPVVGRPKAPSPAAAGGRASCSGPPGSRIPIWWFPEIGVPIYWKIIQFHGTFSQKTIQLLRYPLFQGTSISAGKNVTRSHDVSS